MASRVTRLPSRHFPSHKVSQADRVLQHQPYSLAPQDQSGVCSATLRKPHVWEGCPIGYIVDIDTVAEAAI
jgi:hypothetical protein